MLELSFNRTHIDWHTSDNCWFPMERNLKNTRRCYRVSSFLSSRSSELAPTTSSLVSECYSPPPFGSKEGDTFACWEGVGGPNFYEGTDTPLRSMPLFKHPSQYLLTFLRNPEIDSQPGGPVRPPYFLVYIGWWNRFVGINSWAP